MSWRHRLEAELVRRLPPTASRTLGGLYGFALPARRSYSQFGEDLIVAAFFDEVGVASGNYVDIGAFHPRWLSNTHLLAKRGWSGVVVDIDAHKVGLCTTLRRNCTGITAAVAPEGSPSELEVYKFRRLWSEIDTLSEADAEKYCAEMGIDYDLERVATVTVGEILSTAVERGGPIRFLNIDLEGLDDVILGEVDFARHPVSVVCFENNDRFGGSEASVQRLDSHGYRHLATAGGSHIYVSADLAESAGRWSSPLNRRT